MESTQDKETEREGSKDGQGPLRHAHLGVPLERLGSPVLPSGPALWVGAFGQVPSLSLRLLSSMKMDC